MRSADFQGYLGKCLMWDAVISLCLRPNHCERRVLKYHKCVLKPKKAVQPSWKWMFMRRNNERVCTIYRGINVSWLWTWTGSRTWKYYNTVVIPVKTFPSHHSITFSALRWDYCVKFYYLFICIQPTSQRHEDVIWLRFCAFTFMPRLHPTPLRVLFLIFDLQTKGWRA